MRVKIFAIVLLVASFAFAQFGQAKQKTDKTDYYYHAHDGIYFTTGFTFGYESLNNHYEKSSWMGEINEENSFKGWLTPLIEVRLGGYYANIASIYGAFGFGLGKGDLEYSSYSKDDDDKDTEKASATSLRMYLGLGADFYPFQDKESPLYGLFFGLCGGFAFEGAEITTKHEFHSSDENFHHFFGRIEAGYDWWFSTRWRAGASFNYTFGGFISNEDDNSTYIHQKDRESTTTHTIGLTIRIAH